MNIRFRPWFKIFVSVLALSIVAAIAFWPSEKENKNTAVSQQEISEAVDLKPQILKISQNKLDGKAQELMSLEFLKFFENKFKRSALLELKKRLENGTYTENSWYEITGFSINVLECIYRDVFNKQSEHYNPKIKYISNRKDSTVIRVVGDVSLADNWKIMPEYDKRKKGLQGILSDDVINLMNSADIMLVNNEFTFSDRGSPLAKKYYTFRGSPERVKIFNQLGVDLVSIANNHAYDFGAEAFQDTLDTLKNAHIGYVGGGENIAEASEPYYIIVGGKKIAVTAASRAEKFRLTPGATETTSGIMNAYNVDEYLPTVEEAAKNSDYSISFMHWGKEESNYFDESIQADAKKIIEAGADIIVGAHAHVLQGVEFINNKPVVYNLGNFLFNAETIDTGILEINLPDKGEPTYKFIPCIQKDCYTETVSGDEFSRILNKMKELSKNVDFDEKGYITEAN